MFHTMPGALPGLRAALGAAVRLAALSASGIADCEGHAALAALVAATVRALGGGAGYLAGLERAGARVLASSGDARFAPGAMLPHGAHLHLFAGEGAVVVTDERLDLRARRHDLSLAPYAACAIEPLHWNDEIVASLCVLDAQPRAWTSEDRALVRSMADAAIEIVRAESVRSAAAAARDSALEQERADHRDRQALERCMSAMPIALAVVEPAGRLAACNDHFVRLVDRGSDDLLGADVCGLLPLALSALVASVAGDGRRRERRGVRIGGRVLAACCFGIEGRDGPGLPGVRVGIALMPLTAARGIRAERLREPER